jgi:glycosyltransferase involved in cell wall biosynthesis
MNHLCLGQSQGVYGKLGNRKPLLTICVATYDREHLLERLLSSGMSGHEVPEWNNSVEWIIVDDGSTDNTRAVIDRWRDVVLINYVSQENTGRAKALKKAILLASGQYSIIMDSDDYFTENGLAVVIRELNRLKSETQFKNRPLVGALFGTKIISQRAPAGTDNLPTCEVRTNFVAARADFGCSGDLKEVVYTKTLQKVFNEADFDARRIPTYLWWANVSMRGDCLMIRKVVAVKEYMPDGMTANIFRLKTASPAPMAALYKLLSRAPLYDSVRYRMRSKLLWYRYALLSGNTTDFSLKDRILFSPAWLIYSMDRLRLAWMQRGRQA